MRRRFLLPGLLLLAWLTRAEPARVVSLVPTNGAVAVPVGLTNLVIEFDQDMRSGFSVTGGGPSFPKITGKLQWVTPRRLHLCAGHGAPRSPVVPNTGVYRPRRHAYAGGLESA